VLRTVPLAVLYVVVVIPAGVLLRLTGRPLRTRWDPAATTYWHHLPARKH
jgi:hypothetical protein